MSTAEPSMPQTRVEFLSKWQDTRRRADGIFQVWVSGFGERGDLSLSLASPQITHKLAFKGGIPHREIVPGVLSSHPEIMELRDQIIRSVRAAEAPGRLSVDICLARYSAAIIALSYNVTDDDLEFLHRGEKWIESMTVHAAGGEGFLAKMAQVNIGAMFPAAPPPMTITPPPPTKRKVAHKRGKHVRKT